MRITTGHAALIDLSGVARCGGAAARQKRLPQAANSKST